NASKAPTPLLRPAGSPLILLFLWPPRLVAYIPRTHPSPETHVRRRCLMRPAVLALCCLSLSAPWSLRAGDDKKDEIPAVRALDAKGIKPTLNGLVPRPTRIEGARPLATAVGRDNADRLMKQVDFDKQIVLLFRWGGSGQDKLADEIVPVKNAKEDTEAKVVF